MKITRELMRRVSLLTVSTIALSASNAAWGQNHNGAPNDEIIVTARKVEESLQDVPISISAIGPMEIERKAITDIGDVSKLTAGVIFDDGGIAPQDVRLVIRGLSPTNGRQNAAILQDGIDVSSESILTGGGSLLMNTRLFDLERIEVVKGPQMALFGRSAFAGAVNYVTKKPGDEFEGKVNLDVGDAGQLSIGAGISGPVIEDKLSLGVNGTFFQHNGFYKNSVTGAGLGGTEGYGLAGTAVFTPSENLKFILRAEYSDDESEPRARAIIAANTALDVPASAAAVTPMASIPAFTGSYGNANYNDPGGLVPTLSANPRNGEDYEGVTREIFRGTLTTEWRSDSVNITSLSHYAKADVFQYEDAQIVGSFDTITTPFGWGIGSEFFLDSTTSLVSQELRFASKNDGPFNWMVGGLFWDENVTFFDGSMNVLNLIPGGTGSDALRPVSIGGAIPRSLRFNERKTEHISVFGLLDYEISHQLGLTLEGRLASERLNLTGSSASAISFLPAFGGFPYPAAQGVAVRGTDSDSYFAPKGTVEWTPNSNQLFYASIAKSVKPSGISTISGGAGGLNIENNRFEAEKMVTYEVGAKTTWLDGRFQMNAAAFFEDFSDKQTNSTVILPDTGILGVKPVNASAAEILGLEIDASWSPSEHISFTASYAFLDAEYKDFVTTTSGAVSIASAGNCTVISILGAPQCNIDLSGNRLEQVPKHSLNGSARFKTTLNNNLDWFVETDARYQSKRFDGNTNLRWYDSYVVADLQAGIEGDHWKFTAYVKNVFDDDTIRSGINTTDLQTFLPPAVIYNVGKAMLPDPRTWGLRAGYKF